MLTDVAINATHHPQAPVSAEQHRKNHSSSAKMITHTLAAEGTALVAGGAAHLQQAGLANIQDLANISTGVSQLPHQGMQRHSVTAIMGRSIPQCALQID